MLVLIGVLVLSLVANAIGGAFLWGARHDYRIASKQRDDYRERFCNADDHRWELVAELNWLKKGGAT